MIPRSATEGQKVNSRKADEVFAEHGDGWTGLLEARDAPFLSGCYIGGG